MRKHILYLLLIFCVPVFCFASPALDKLKLVIVAANSSDPTAGYIIEEDFEETGVPTAGNWAYSSGTVDWDQTTGAIAGAESLELLAGGRVYTTALTGDDVWVFCMWGTDDGQPSATNTIFSIRDSTDTVVGKVIAATAGGIWIYNGTVNHASSFTLDDGAVGPYAVWFRLVRGSGSGDGEAHIWFDLVSNVCTAGVCTRPEAEAVTAVSTGNWDSGDNDAYVMYLICAGTDNKNIIDTVLYRNTEINTVTYTP